MQILLSVLSILMIYLMGKKWKHAPLVGLISQVAWTIYIVQTNQWGLMISVVVYALIHAKNYYYWLKEE